MNAKGLAWALATWVGLASIAPMQAEAAPPDKPDSGDWLYRIQPGDTLFALTEAYLQDRSSWRELQRVNHVANPLRLPPGGTLKMPVALLRREASVATVLFTQSEVSLIRAPNAATALQTGTQVQAGDRLRTGEQGSISLRFVDGSRLLVAPGSEVSIEELLVYGRSAIPSMKLRLNKGSADSKVEKSSQRPANYELRTPSLNLGVRGTEFRVQVGDDGQSTHAEVLEGVVAAGSTPVEAGFGAAVTPGQVGLQLGRLLPAPDLSAVPPKLDRLPLTINWAAQPEAKAWRAQVFALGDFERLLLDGRFNRPQAAWGLAVELPDGRYTLRVRAIDALGLEGLATDRAFTLKARPEPPFSRAPSADAVIYGDQLDLAWTRPVNALNFRIQVAESPDFAKPLLDRADLADTELRLTLRPGRYHYRLASITKDADLGPFGDPQALTMRPIPPSPALSPPEIGDKDLTFRWPAAVGAARYKTQWASDPEFKQVLTESSTDQPTLTLPRPGTGSYYLRVQSVDADGYAGPFGTPQQIDIPRSRWLWLLPLGLLLLAM